jgi:hypothetical protein
LFETAEFSVADTTILRKPSRSRSPGAASCRRKFLYYFPRGFGDETYLAWERAYKAKAHQRWTQELGRVELRRLMHERDYREIARRAVNIESRTNLIFSYEKMALRDAVNAPGGARAFATGLERFLAGKTVLPRLFDERCETVGSLPRRGSRVLTWPVVTVFGFLAQPKRHLFIKPNVMKRAAKAYGFPFEYDSKPSFPTYASALAFAAEVARDLRDLRPRDMIDIQSFLWVQGSDEYPD